MSGIWSFLPFQFDFTDGGLIAVAIGKRVEQALVQLQTVAPCEWVRDKWYFAVSQQAYRYLYWWHLNVLCFGLRAAGQQRQQEQAEQRTDRL